MILLLAILLAVFVLPAPWDVVAIVAGCVLEIGEVVVLRRWSRRLDRRLRPVTGPSAMVGKTGQAVSACRPTGQVRVAGEIWTATCAAGVDEGDEIRVESVDELSLVVSPVEPGRSPTRRRRRAA